MMLQLITQFEGTEQTKTLQCFSKILSKLFTYIV